jgi:hypothetical protein
MWMREPESYPHFSFEQAYQKMMEGSEGATILDYQRTNQEDGSVLMEITVDLTQPFNPPFHFTYGFLFRPIFKN